MSSIDEEEFDNIPLFTQKGFSRNWNDIDLRKRNTYGFLVGDQQAASEGEPDLDYGEIDLVDNKDVDYHTDNLELEEPEGEDDHEENVFQNNSFRRSLEVVDRLSASPLISDLEDVKSEGKPASVHTPENKHLLSNDTSEFRKEETLAQSKDLLREKIDNNAHVKKCLNRKDVVVKSILRTMRKYYADLIQDNSEYKRKIRNIKVKHQTLINCALELARTLELSENYDYVAFYLIAVAFPTDLRKILNKGIAAFPNNKNEFAVGLKEIDVIENAMTRYNKKVMKDFMKVPEISLLLIYYLNKVNNEDYDEHFRALKDMATSTVKENSMKEEISTRPVNSLLSLCLQA